MVEDILFENEKARQLYQEYKGKNPIGTAKINLKGSLVSKPIYEIPIRFLRYNDANFRIRHQVDAITKEEDFSPIEDENEDQSWIQEQLYQADKKTNDDIYRSIEIYGQKEPLIVRQADAIVVDGNRRLMTLNRLLKGGHVRFETAQVIVVEEDLSDTEWLELEARYQFEKPTKSSYDNINEAKILQRLYDIHKDYDAVALRADSKSKFVENRILTLSLIDSYLERIGLKDRYSKIPSFELFRVLAEQLDKNERTYSPEELVEFENYGLNLISLRIINDEASKNSEEEDNGDDKVNIDDRTFRNLLKAYSLESAKDALTQTVSSSTLKNLDEMKKVRSDFSNDVSTAFVIQQANKQANEPLRMITLAINHLKNVQTFKGNTRNDVTHKLGELINELARIRTIMEHERTTI
ncbi:hypothetical protein SPFL3102_00590 [Sporomusaceae bacterium FL31]|nr:hypothetical protein SPFL3101_01361 [Sporomusaceae bacterium FL31]GCE32793.1 hypothetical protein SPFL3102_00590 [Sporomusaceae bacterium]